MENNVNLDSKHDNSHFELDIFLKKTLGDQSSDLLRSKIKWITKGLSGKEIFVYGNNAGLTVLLLAKEGVFVSAFGFTKFSAGMLRQLLAREEETVRERVRLIEGDINYDLISSKKYDGILLDEVNGSLSTDYQKIEILKSCLSANGVFIFANETRVIPGRKSDHFTVDLIKLVWHIGCKLSHVHFDNGWVGLHAIPKNTGDFLEFDEFVKFVSGYEQLLVNKETCLTSEVLRQNNENVQLKKECLELMARSETLNKEVSDLDFARKAANDALQRAIEERVSQKKKIDQYQRQVELLTLDKQSVENSLERLAAERSEQLLNLNEVIHQSALCKLESKLQIKELEAKLQEENLKNISALEKIDLLKKELSSSVGISNHFQQYLVQKNEEIDSHLALSQDLAAQLRESRFCVDRLNLQTEQLKIELDSIKKKVVDVESEKKELKVKLDSANIKYRTLTSDVIPKLKQKTAMEIGNVNLKIQKMQIAKISLEKQIIKTRSSLSFRLGYLLIHNVKTLRGILSLPFELWHLRKIAIERRNVKSNDLASIKNTSVTVMNSQCLKKEVIPFSNLQTTNASTLRVLNTAKKVKVACVMDEFTFLSFKNECNLFQLSPSTWQQELIDFQPDFLFIESAWRGKDEKWGNKISHNSTELQGVVKWCAANKIPTVFWNKEDPVHFETFLNTAQHFDYVFTTDIDCIAKYKSFLNHDRVFLLPFAVQPTMHNPIEKYDREDAICFAGAYYVKYPERNRDLNHFVTELSSFKPFKIYDRNFGKNDLNYQFPEQYKPYIVGTLPFSEIDKAYKGYAYSLNLNSIKNSQTMFARRVYELLASNTVTVSNYSRGLRMLFGDLILTTDNATEVTDALKKLVNSNNLNKFKLLGLRKVMSEHLYEHRLNYIISKLSPSKSVLVLESKIVVFSFAKSTSDIRLIRENYERQKYLNSKLVVFVTKSVKNYDLLNDKIEFVNYEDHMNHTFEFVFGTGVRVSYMHPDDYYGPHYLSDINHASKFGNFDVIGKGSFYECLAETINLKFRKERYRVTSNLMFRRSVCKIELLSSVKIGDLINIESSTIDSSNALSIDEFNYCENIAISKNTSYAISTVNDMESLDCGMPISDVLQISENISPEGVVTQKVSGLTINDIAELFTDASSSNVKIELTNTGILIDSKLLDGKHDYLYAKKGFLLDEKIVVDGQIKFYFESTPGLNLQMVFFFLDQQKQRISHVIKAANKNHIIDVPIGAVSLRLGLRVYASGSSVIKQIAWQHIPSQVPNVLSNADCLLLTNHYPSYADLYRNAFVHSRVKSYKASGLNLDVFRVRENEQTSFYVHEGVDVISAPLLALRKMLSTGRYKTILVHFLDENMWKVLRQFVDNHKIIVWVHGAEIQPAFRRSCNHRDEDEQAVEEMKNKARVRFWSSIFKEMHPNMKFVFVSKYFADQVMEDYKVSIPLDRYFIIHNSIDDDLFTFQHKSPDLRKKILSIRPFTSANYANDLTVKVILLLSQKSWFKDLEFTIIGDGPLFDSTLEEIKKFPNVTILKKFITQREIAVQHKQFGIFLCPTRLDTQGVSRDEAMSSGLVPITNKVAAIPEFTDEHCAILAGAEDVEAMAAGIELLYTSPDTFLLMSKSAAQRVREQSSKSKMIESELRIICPNVKSVKLDLSSIGATL